MDLVLKGTLNILKWECTVFSFLFTHLCTYFLLVFKQEVYSFCLFCLYGLTHSLTTVLYSQPFNVRHPGLSRLRVKTFVSKWPWVSMGNQRNNRYRRRDVVNVSSHQRCLWLLDVSDVINRRPKNVFFLTVGDYISVYLYLQSVL